LIWVRFHWNMSMYDFCKISVWPKCLETETTKPQWPDRNSSDWIGQTKKMHTRRHCLIFHQWLPKLKGHKCIAQYFSFSDGTDRQKCLLWGFKVYEKSKSYFLTKRTCSTDKYVEIILSCQRGYAISSLLHLRLLKPQIH